MLYTSYYAINGKSPRAIAISLSMPWELRGNHEIPEWFKGRVMKKLAPKRWWFNKWKYQKPITLNELDQHGISHLSYLANKAPNNDDYEVLYRETVLKHLNAKDIAEEAGDGAIFLCYEKGFCHRHILSKWLNENGYECKEMGEGANYEN